MNLAPIVLFIYNRADILDRTLNTLSRNVLAKESILYIYADGAKENATEKDREKIQQARAVAKSKQWCKEVHIIEREKNLGLSNSIIAGVTEVINKHGKVIVLEDDLELSPYFLKYMNDALNMYEKEPKVWSIGACNFFSTYSHTPETFFIPIPDCWGWATWADRWQYFEPDSKKLLQQLKDRKLEEDFNLYGTYDFIGMLQAQAEGKISSWAIRWQAQAYLHNALTLYPKYSLTNHLASNEATHAANFSLTQYIIFPNNEIKLKKEKIVFLESIKKDLIKAYKKIYGSSYYQRNLEQSMKAKIKYLLKKITPPVVVDAYKALRAYQSQLKEKYKQNTIFWEGNFTSWQEAQQKTDGYDAPQILAKVREATMKVKNGEAVYERDSVIFDKIQYNWPLLACLLKVAVENNNELKIIDFGGSLGSSYFQNIHFLKSIKKVQWTVVEQEHFVKCGREEISHNGLDFAYTIEEALKQNKANLLLLSGVIQCLDKPYEWIDKFLSYNFDYIIIDRTAFIEDSDDRLTIQYVPEWIYKASYPAWFLNEVKLLNIFLQKYQLLSEFDSFADGITYLEDNKKCYRKGFFLKLKTT
ncbi:MAG: methyltransferase, TIGR04325 family [Microscillaceae bacterium]|nr:methyltransferase, TIGR04325 family [Microscillaceae bacterium]MDW8459995.1 methyltransferase, TIGR04325 family [Cytophagales bacterium]